MDNSSPDFSRRRNRSALGVLRGIGAFRLAAGSRWRNRRLIILVYHGVSIGDEHLWDPELYLSPEEFRRSLETIRGAGCTVVGLREAVERLAKGDLPPRAVSLTFDDGNFDFASRALPLLQEYGFPATVFMSTYYSRHQRPVFNPACGYLLWKAGGQPIPAEDLGLGPDALQTSDLGARYASFRRVQALLAEKELSGAAKDDLLGELARRVGVDMESLSEKRVFHLMDGSELASLPPDLIDVQLHTHRHRAPSDRELFLKEIEDNRRFLVDAPGSDRQFDQFCYPSGHHRPEFLPWLRETGVTIGLTCDVGLASTKHEPLLLPRVAVTTGLPGVELEASLTGARDLLRVRPF